MRTLASFLFSLLVGSITAQIADGVEAYKSGDYEQSIIIFDQSLRKSEDSSIKAEGYFYRAIARRKLGKQDPHAYALGFNPLVASVKDLMMAKNLDSKWEKKADEQLLKLHPLLLKKGKKELKELASIEVNELKVGRLEAAISYYDAASQIETSYDINEQLGFLYEQIGSFYYETRETESAYNKAFVFYEKAI